MDEETKDLYKPNAIQVRFRGLFAPIPQVTVRGDYRETDFVEASLVEIGDAEMEHVIPRALDGCLVRLIARWENKQFEKRVATFSRLKILHGERNRRYRLRITWFEADPNLPGTFRQVASITTAETFTIRAHHSKRGAGDAADNDDEGQPHVQPITRERKRQSRDRTGSVPAPAPAPASASAVASHSAVGIPTPPSPSSAAIPYSTPAQSAPVYSFNPAAATAPIATQYVHFKNSSNSSSPIVRHVPHARHSSSNIVQLPSQRFYTAPDISDMQPQEQQQQQQHQNSHHQQQYMRSNEDVAGGLRRSRRLSAQGTNSNSSLSSTIAASSNSSVFSNISLPTTATTSSTHNSSLTDSRETQLHDFSEEDIGKFLEDTDISTFALPEQRRGSGFFSRRSLERRGSNSGQQ